MKWCSRDTDFNPDRRVEPERKMTVTVEYTNGDVTRITDVYPSDMADESDGLPAGWIGIKIDDSNSTMINLTKVKNIDFAII